MKRRNKTANTQPESLHRTSRSSLRNRGARTLIILSVGLVLSGALALALTACNLFGSFDNPVDPFSDDFQGYLSADVKDMTIGGSHVLMVTEGGDLYAWGNNFDGQLGIGGTDDMYSPVSVGLENIAEVTAGSSHSLALDEDGTLWGWGGVKRNELGTDVDGAVLEGGENRQYMEPVRLKENILSVCAGDHFSAVMDGDGKIYAWGEINTQRDFEGDMLFESAEPVQLSLPSGFSAQRIWCSHSMILAIAQNGENCYWGYDATPPGGIWFDEFEMWENQKVNLLAAGNRHFLATDEAGDLYAMGRNEYGQLGAFTANPDDYNDVLVSISTAGFTDIAAGGDSSFAVTEEGKLFVWGSNNNGCLGLPYWQFEVFYPVGVDTEYDYVFEGAEVFTNGETTFLALPDNSLIPWGSNNEGLYGIGKTGAPSMSLEKFTVDVSSVDDPVIMSADGGGGGDGGSFGIFCSQDGTVWGWGVNESGQLGLGDTSFRAAPAQASIPEHVTKVAAGDNFIIASDSNGELWACGDNNEGQLGKGDNVGTSTPALVTSPGSDCGFFDCGENHAIAVYGSAHSVYSWGYNADGQLGLGDNNDRNSPVEVTGIDAEVLDVACGSWHSVVLDENGNVWTWGDNDNGQLGDGTTTERNTPYKLEASLFGGQAVVDVEAGGGVSFAITEDDRLWAWGDKGTLGYDYEYDDVDSTKPIPYLDNIRSVASSGGSLIVYTKDGILYYMDDGIDPTLMEYEESEYISDVEGNGIILRESDIWSADRNLQMIEGGGGHFFFIDDAGTLYAF